MTVVPRRDKPAAQSDERGLARGGVSSHDCVMRGKHDHDDGDAHAFRYVAAVCGAVAANTAIPPAGRVDPVAIEMVMQRHRIAPRAVAALAAAVRPHDPAMADHLAAHARERRLAALHRTARLAAVSSALSAAGIRHLGIKGPVLAQQLYGDVAARDSKDIDLLIDPAGVVQAAAVLRLTGFEEVMTHAQASERFANKHLTFTGHGIEIEMHTRLLDIDTLLSLSFEALWSRRAMVMLGSVAVPALSSVDTLLYLCAHGSQHLWFRLKWLEDIARIVSLAATDTYPTIVGDAIRAARTTGAEATVVGAVQLIDQIFDISAASPIPGTRASRRIVRLSAAALAAPADYADAPPLGWIVRKMPVQFAMGTSWRYRRDLIRLLVLAPRDFDATLPRGLGWMRLPLRPAMLLRDRWVRR